MNNKFLEMIIDEQGVVDIAKARAIMPASIIEEVTDEDVSDHIFGILTQINLPEDFIKVNFEKFPSLADLININIVPESVISDHFKHVLTQASVELIAVGGIGILSAVVHKGIYSQHLMESLVVALLSEVDDLDGDDEAVMALGTFLNLNVRKFSIDFVLENTDSHAGFLPATAAMHYPIPVDIMYNHLDNVTYFELTTILNKFLMLDDDEAGNKIYDEDLGLTEKNEILIKELLRKKITDELYSAENIVETLKVIAPTADMEDDLDAFRCNECGNCHELCRCGEGEDVE